MKTGIQQINSKWCVYFTIDDQTFHLQPCKNKKNAKWFLKQLRHAFSKVDFPAALSPTIARISPWSSLMLTLLSALIVPKFFDIFISSRKGLPIILTPNLK